MPAFSQRRGTGAETNGAADYRTLYDFEDVPLRKDWNNVLIKLVGDKAEGDDPATLAVRIGSNNADFLHQVDSAAEIKP